LLLGGLELRELEPPLEVFILEDAPAPYAGLSNTDSAETDFVP